MTKAAAVKKTEGQFSSRILVNIERDMTTKTPKVIWRHELAVLEAVFGEGKVVEVDSADMDDGYVAKTPASMLIHNKKQDKILPPSATAGLGFLFVGDADSEHDRLSSVYGMDPDEKIAQVEKVYGRRAEGRLRRLLVMPELSDLPEAQLRGILLDNGIEFPVNEKEVPIPVDHAGLLALAKSANFELA